MKKAFYEKFGNQLITPRIIKLSLMNQVANKYSKTGMTVFVCSETNTVLNKKRNLSQDW